MCKRFFEKFNVFEYVYVFLLAITRDANYVIVEIFQMETDRSSGGNLVRAIFTARSMCRSTEGNYN